MKTITSTLLLLLLSTSARAQNYAYEQPMSAGGGVLRWSQLWVDPAGHNDSDLDSLAWENFEFPTGVTVSKLRWWGQAALPLGFRIGFYHQDPTTIAVQPDIFTPNSTPISEREYTTFSQLSVGGGLFRFDLELATPLSFAADTRYFVSVVGLTPLSYVTWSWAQGTGGVLGTFWWNRGAHMYYHLGDDRAVGFATSAGWPIGMSYCFGDGSGSPCPCSNPGGTGQGCANSTGSGATLTAFGQATVGADTVVLVARQCPPTTPGLFFGGSNALVGLPFGDGLRCVGGGLVRLGVRTPDGAGAATWGPGLAALGDFEAGVRRRFQVWYRDPLASPCGARFNLTHGHDLRFAP